jgi:hypothetical protein
VCGGEEAVVAEFSETVCSVTSDTDPWVERAWKSSEVVLAAFSDAESIVITEGMHVL